MTMKASKITYGIAAAVGSAFALFVVFVFLQPADREQVTPYADFERDLAAGKVEEVRIDGTTYHYRIARDSTRHETTGPKATLAAIDAMKGDGATPPPKVYVEP